MNGSHPGEGLFEVPKDSSLSPLSDALTEEAHQARLAAEASAHAEPSQAASDAAQDSEEARQQRIKNAAAAAIEAARKAQHDKMEPSEVALHLRVQQVQQRLTGLEKGLVTRGPSTLGAVGASK